MSGLKIWTDRTVWYVAATAEDATEMQKTDLSSDEVTPVDKWSEVISEKMTIRDDDGTRTTKTLAEWIASNGPGFLASTEV
jgi:hypothetical protein